MDELRMMWHACSVHWRDEECVQNINRKRALGRRRSRWKDNIKVNFGQTVLDREPMA
jgi:hypothetical protein